MPPHLKQSRYFCFTIFCRPTMEDGVQHIHDVLCRSFNPGVYGGRQLEICPLTSREHWQGFCVVKDKTTIKGMKKKYSSTHFIDCDDVHWEIMQGTLEQSEEYCSKEETRAPGELPITWGVRPQTGQGARNDLLDAVNTLRAGGVEEVINNHPVAFVRYSAGFMRMAQFMKEKTTFKLPDGWEWKEWQAELIEELDEKKPHARKIIWIYDAAGAAGKSTIVRYMCANSDACLLEGKIADMAYAYQKQKIVFFDISRTQAEHMDHLYSFAEKLKNGMIMSTKYESRMKYFDVPHVVFMSNSLPDMTKWSADRYDVRDVNELFF